MRTVPQKTLLAICLASVSGFAAAHGYVSSKTEGAAASRVALCKFADKNTNQKNRNCGSIQWEPQSVEGPDGFPARGPADGQIAAGGTTLAQALNEQTADRWVKQPISAGPQKFEWNFTAAHVTKDWDYYITKPNWNPNQVLSRNSFDLTPFCSVDGGMRQPNKTTIHNCVVPQREGYHVILAVWDVGDTAAAFYNVMDVQFNGQNAAPAEWQMSGQILASMNLNVSDEVYTRVFDNQGENLSLSTRLTITETLTNPKQWSRALAQKINQTQSQIKAGKLGSNNQFTPQFGPNPIYLKSSSQLQRVEIGYDMQTPAIDYNLALSGLDKEYSLDNGTVQLALNLMATGDQNVEMTVYNHSMQAIAARSVSMRDGDSRAVNLALNGAAKGHHMLVVRSKNSQGKLLDQTTYDFTLVENSTTPPSGGDDNGGNNNDGGNNGGGNNGGNAGGYDYVFPNGIKSYSEGTKVLADDGNVYQCKPFPYSGFCVQWSESANHYQPGVGSHWDMAWQKL